MTTDVREARLPALDEHSRRETGNELQATLIEDLQGLSDGCPRHKPTRSMPKFLTFEES
jgi:hypothetical protein